MKSRSSIIHLAKKIPWFVYTTKYRPAVVSASDPWESEPAGTNWEPWACEIADTNWEPWEPEPWIEDTDQ